MSITNAISKRHGSIQVRPRLKEKEKTHKAPSLEKKGEIHK